MQQSVLTREHAGRWQRSRALEHGAFIDAAHLDFRGNILDALLRGEAASELTHAMVTVPSSAISIVVPVSSVIARITGRFADDVADFSGLILMTSMRGA